MEYDTDREVIGTIVRSQNHLQAILIQPDGTKKSYQISIGKLLDVIEGKLRYAQIYKITSKVKA